MQPGIREEREKAKDVQTKLEYTTLEKVTAFTQILYDPDPLTSVVPQDASLVEDYWEMAMDEVDPHKFSPWVLRMQLSNKVMADKKLTMRDVETSIQDTFESDLHVIGTDDNADELVIRVR